MKVPGHLERFTAIIQKQLDKGFIEEVKNATAIPK